MKTKINVADAYDKAAPASANAGAASPSDPSSGGSFSDSYDEAQPDGQDPEGSEDQSADAQPLEIQATDVQKMETLKQSGDMKGLGEYVAQFLN